MQTDLFSLSRRVAIVTGSARGLGRALENIMEGMVAEHARPETEERIRTRTPLGRRARLEELVGPVVFFASDAASYVTGAVLAVDGGYTSV